MSSINFDNAWLLLIAVPLVLIFSVPFFIAVRKENANGHNIASQVIHVLLAVLVAFAAAGTSIKTVLTETDVYVVADVSFSANRNLDAVDNYIKRLDLPQNCKMGLVCFGKDAALVYGMGDPRRVPSVKNSGVDDSETNIAEALEFTGELFRGDVIKRIVLITDGRQTDETDEYAVTRAVDGLEAKNIRVDAIYLDDNINGNVKEVQISGVQYTKNTFIGKEEEAVADIQSTYLTDAVVSLARDGEVISERSVTLSAGVNSVGFDLSTQTEGVYDYEVKVSAAGDTNGYNNNYIFTQAVVTNAKVLYISQNWENCKAAVERYGDSASIDIYEHDNTVFREDKHEYAAQHADNQNLNIHVLDYDIPYEIEDLCAYDEIVLDDCNISDFTNYNEFIKNLDIAVSMFGKSLVTIGNMYIQTSSDDAKAALGDMLPVRYGNDSADPKLYTIVFDASRSMRWLYHLDVAKELAIRLLDLLGEKDEICFITFFGEVREPLPPTPITPDTRERLIEIINNITVTQGTLLGSGMNMAYRQIREYANSDKQVMFISDGLSFGTDLYDPLEIVGAMYDDGIVTSIFDVGRQGDREDGSNINPEAMAARTRLMQMAETGHGKYFYSNNAEALDDVTFGEIADQISVTVVEKETAVNVARRTDGVLEGINLNNIPKISGYVFSGIKPSATTVLTLSHQRAAGEVQAPLYAYWKYGNGRVSTFTSNTSGEWFKNWQNGVGDSFITNVYKQNMPAERTDVPYTLSMVTEGRQCNVTLTPANYEYGTVAVITVTSPDGNTFTDVMDVANNYYYSRFDNVQTGRYDITIKYSYHGLEYLSQMYYTQSYVPEYDSFGVYSPSELYRALNGRGVVSLDGSLSLKTDEDELEMYKYELTVPILIAAAVLYIIDIIVRKLRIEDIKSFFGIGKKNRKKGGKQK